MNIVDRLRFCEDALRAGVPNEYFGWAGDQPSAGWQPIETAPKDRRIIVFRPHGTDYIPKVGEDYWSVELGNCWAHSNSSVQPTHWMPLPDPPAGHVGRRGE
jgi:hypothetical protein